MSDTGPVLSVEDLTTDFVSGGTVTHAVRGVSFELQPGDKLGIVGESGCGKSALALSIAQLIEPPGRTGGQVRVNGRSITGLTERQLARVRGRQVSLIFQDPMDALDPVRTVGRQVAEAIRAHQARLSRPALRRRMADLLDEVGVSADRASHYPHQFSGGMRQRVMIAIALANDPDVVIADEPTTALDATTQAQVLALLDRLASERGAAIVLISHDLGVVAGFCHRVRVMYAGRFVEGGDVGALVSRPAHPYTKGLLASRPSGHRASTGPLPSIPGLPPSLTDLPLGCPFAPRCPVGGGEERCRTIPPPIVRPAGHPPGTFAECHFARYPTVDGGQTASESPDPG